MVNEPSHPVQESGRKVSSLFGIVLLQVFFFSRLEGTILAWGLMVQSVVVEKAWCQGLRLDGLVCHGGDGMVAGV